MLISGVDLVNHTFIMQKFQRPNEIVRTNEPRKDVNWELMFFYRFLTKDRKKSRAYYFPDVLVEDVWRIVDSYFWFDTKRVVTLSVPFSEVLQRHEQDFVLTRMVDVFCGYEDGSKLSICANKSNNDVFGYFPLWITKIPFTTLYINNPILDKRVLVQLHLDRGLGGPFDFYFIWQGDLSAQFQTCKDAEEYVRANAPYLGVDDIFKVRCGNLALQYL